MNIFDALMDDLDSNQMDTFGVAVIIDGREFEGIFDEEPTGFEGVDTMYRTLEVPASVLPSSVSEESVVTLVDDGRTFRVYRVEQLGTQMVMELR